MHFLITSFTNSKGRHLGKILKCANLCNKIKLTSKALPENYCVQEWSITASISPHLEFSHAFSTIQVKPWRMFHRIHRMIPNTLMYKWRINVLKGMALYVINIIAILKPWYCPHDVANTMVKWTNPQRDLYIYENAVYVRIDIRCFPGMCGFILKTNSLKLLKSI